MSCLLDADGLSQPAKTHADRTVLEWLEREQAACYPRTIVAAQIAYWVRTKEGRTRTRLQQWLRRSAEALEGRILSFNVATAQVWADQKFLLEQAVQPMPVEDSYIAATARRLQLTIVAGKDKDFRQRGLNPFNPFKERAKLAPSDLGRIRRS